MNVIWSNSSSVTIDCQKTYENMRNSFKNNESAEKKCAALFDYCVCLKEMESFFLSAPLEDKIDGQLEKVKGRIKTIADLMEKAGCKTT